MTTKADTSVKFFRWDSADAPALSGQAGKLIDVLDACLVNGFSTRTPDSVVVSGGVATVSIGAGNPYEQHAVVSVAGASVAALNGEWKIATAGASTFTFVCPGVADGAATGAVVKRAGAGWAKPFSGANLAVYQSVAPDALQLFFQVDDAASTYAGIRGCGQATAADAVDDLFPTTAQESGGSFGVRKSVSADSTQRPWAVIADDKFVYVLVAWNHTQPSYHAWNVSWFGDFVPLIDASTAHCAIAMSRSSSQSWPGQNSGASHLARTVAQYSYRGFNPGGISGVTQDNQAPQAFAVTGVAFANLANYPPGSPASGVLYPFPNNRIDYCTPIFASKFEYGAGQASVGFWGVQPGRAAPLQYGLPYTLSGNLRLPLKVNGHGAEEGKTYLAFLVGGENSTGHGGILVDITGPWR